MNNMFPGCCFFFIIMQVKCVDFVLAILYIVLVSLFLGGGLIHRAKSKKKSSPSSEPKGEQSSVKPDTIQAQVYLILCLAFAAALLQLKFLIALFYVSLRCYKTHHREIGLSCQQYKDTWPDFTGSYSV